MSVRRTRGCVEMAAIALFALLIGVYVGSTAIRHLRENGNGEPAGVASGDRVPSPPADRHARTRIRVEVRNGSGQLGAAERMTAYLREEGFDVVNYGNAERFDHARTVVIDRSGAPALAREVAATLQGVPIRSEPDSTLFLDVTVLIGGDLPRVLDGMDGGDPSSSVGWRDDLERLWPW